MFFVMNSYTLTDALSHTHSLTHARALTHTQTMIVCRCSSCIDNDNNYADSLIEVQFYYFDMPE